MAIIFHRLGPVCNKIGRELTALNHTVTPNLRFSLIVRFTGNGVELTPINNRIPSNDREPVGIGCNWLSKKMRKTLKEKSLLLNDSVEGWMIKNSFRSLIKQGAEKSREVLRCNGISICEIPDIKTIQDLANFASDRLGNQLLRMTGAVDKIRDAVDNLQIKTCALKAAAMLGQIDKTEAIFDDLAAEKNAALIDGLFNPLEKIQDANKALSFMPTTEGKDRAEEGTLKIAEISAYVSRQLSHILESEYENTRLVKEGMIQNIGSVKICLENIDKIIADSKTKANSMHKIKMTVNGLSVQITILNKLLDEINVSAKKIQKLKDNLTDLSIQCRYKTLTAALRDEIFSKEGPADKAAGPKELPPHINKEIFCPTDISTEKHDAFFPYKMLLRQKLGNVLTYPNGFADILLLNIDDSNCSNHVASIRNGIEKCRATINTFIAFSRKFNGISKGEMGPLAYLLTNEKEDIADDIKQLSSDRTENNRLPRIAAAVAVLCMPVLDMISRQLTVLEQSDEETKKRAAIKKISFLFEKLKNIKNALTDKPSNKEMALASKTIDYIVGNS